MQATLVTRFSLRTASMKEEAHVVANAHEGEDKGLGLHFCAIAYKQ